MANRREPDHSVCVASDRLVERVKRYGRVDQNHAAIRDYFRAHGCEWEDTKDLGGGFPDALVGFGANIALIECKGRRGRSTDDQRKFWERFPVRVVRTDEDAAEVIRWMKGTR